MKFFNFNWKWYRCFKPDFIDLMFCQSFIQVNQHTYNIQIFNILNYDKPLPVAESRKCYVSLTVAEHAEPSSIQSWIGGVCDLSCVKK